MEPDLPPFHAAPGEIGALHQHTIEGAHVKLLNFDGNRWKVELLADYMQETYRLFSQGDRVNARSAQLEHVDAAPIRIAYKKQQMEAEREAWSRRAEKIARKEKEERDAYEAREAERRREEQRQAEIMRAKIAASRTETAELAARLAASSKHLNDPLEHHDLMEVLSTPDLVEAFMEHVDINFLFAAALSCKAFGAARAALVARDREKAARPSAPKKPTCSYILHEQAIRRGEAHRSARLEDKEKYLKLAKEDKERWVRECEAAGDVAPCNGALVPFTMIDYAVGQWIPVRSTTQRSAMFLGSTSLREWAVSVGCPVPMHGAGGFHPFFDKLKLFPGHPEWTVLPDNSGKRYEEWPLTDEQWETPAYCHTHINLKCWDKSRNHTRALAVFRAHRDRHDPSASNATASRAPVMVGTKTWHASNGAYLTVRDLVHAIAESMGDYDDEFNNIWCGLTRVKNLEHAFEPVWDGYG